ncbi:MAG: DNA primase [Desulfobacteraceae bacterium]|nr:DNA primase [Desulfobacteraceae bacterium]MBC2718474.1 DNA primase [Desulfobacteraceae bacterium]
MAVFIPEDKISEIKNIVDIVDIISDIVLLKKVGRNYVGLCPFHTEKTPSFTVSPEKQIFYCFGCGTGGNVFNFLMNHDGLSFFETAKMLANRYGIEIPAQTMSPEQKRRISERESLFAANKQAMDFFKHSLLSDTGGKIALEYLEKRGIEKDNITKFNLGFVPAGWDNLINYFSKKNISHELVEKSGLIIKRKSKNGFYDRFRNRIIFPIFDVSKQVLGFGGRVMDDSLPKYLNSPETPVYNKSRSLYGLHIAKEHCRASETVYIVEGYFDLLALHQHGILNSVATLGTSLTQAHVRILRGFVGKNGRFILVYDSDEAGIKAAERSIKVFDKAYVNAQILVLSEGYDPDSYLFEFGYKSFMDAASKAKSIIPFLIDSAVKKYGLFVEGKIRIISDLKQPLANINDSVERSLYIKELAEIIGIDEAAVMEKVRIVSGNKSIKANKDPSDKMRDKNLMLKGNRLERRIIAMMLQFPEILPEIITRKILDRFENKFLSSIGQLVLKQRDKEGLRDELHDVSTRGNGLISDIINSIDDREQRSIVASLSIGEDQWIRAGCLKLLSQFESIRNRQEKTLLQKIRAAEESNDHGLLLELLKKKQIQVRKNPELGG